MHLHAEHHVLGCAGQRQGSRRLVAARGQARPCERRRLAPTPCPAAWPVAQRHHGWGAAPHLVVAAAQGKGGFGAKDKQSVSKAERDCPCGSGQQFKACCQPYLDSSDTPLFLKRPPSAESCLRAQFSAYVLKKHRYVLKTTSADNPSRKGSDSQDGKVHRTYEQDVKATMAWADFRKLDVVEQRQEGDDVLISFQMESRMLYDLKTGQPLKDTAWQVLKQTARFRQEQDGWMHLRTEASNWDRETQQILRVGHDARDTEAVKKRAMQASLRAGSTLQQHHLRHRQHLRPNLKTSSFLSSLFGGGGMGNAQTSTRGWTPGTGSEPRKISKSGYDVTPLTPEQREAAARSLPNMAKYVTLEHGTERAFTGSTVDGTPHSSKQRGVWVCALGGLPLFTTDTKFDSGTGWPSFFAPIDKEHIVEVLDTSIPYMPRTEVLCARSGAHLGHVFDDGPRPTGKRYCINAAALRFVPEGEPLPPESQPVQQQ